MNNIVNLQWDRNKPQRARIQFYFSQSTQRLSLWPLHSIYLELAL